MTDTSLDLTISRTLKAPRAAVWKAWTEKKHIEEWWCPKPWKAHFTGFEMKPGGAFECQMSGPDGAGHFVPGCILDIQPKERVVFTTALSGGWRPVDSFVVITAIISFTDAGTGTAYSARVLHKDAESVQQHLEMGFHDGWGTCIAQLDELAVALSS